MAIGSFFLKMAKLADKIEKNIDTDKIVEAIKNSQNRKLQQVFFGNEKLKKLDVGIREVFIRTNNFDVCVMPSEEKAIEIFMLESMNEKLLNVDVDTEGTTFRMNVFYADGNNTYGLVLLKGFADNSLTVITDNGDVTVTKSSGKLYNLDAKNGDIKVVDTNFERAIINSKNGCVEFSQCNFESAMVETKNGDIAVKLFDDCDIDLHSVNGDIDCDRSLDVKNSKRTLKCRSKNGDITVQKA